MKRFELATPVNFRLARGVEGGNGFELGDAEYEPSYLSEGDCITVWSVGMTGIDPDNVMNEVMDWTNRCGKFRDEDAWCEAAVWAVACGSDGVAKVIELDEFTMREHCWIADELRASLAHNAA